MSSRRQILSTLGHALNQRAPHTSRLAAARARIAEHAANLIPERGQLTPAKRLKLFIDYATGADATVRQVGSADEVTGAIAEFLAAHNLAASIVRAPDPALDAISWDKDSLLTLKSGKPDPGDDTGVTGALAAIAETGTLMMASGAHHPTTLNFLPENHIVVVWKDQIAGSYEDAWARLRESAGGEAFAMPRTVNFITGPSRSADIEQTLQLGAHGPRRLHIIVVDEQQGRKKAKK